MANKKVAAKPVKKPSRKAESAVLGEPAMEIDEIIRKRALQNAINFKGRANPGAVLGKILSEKPELKPRIKSLQKMIERIIKDVNALPIEAQEKELKKTAPQLLEKSSAAKKTLPELKGAVQGEVVTRFPPEPSKYAHIGHGLSFIINYLYAQKYNGKCVLRFEDTNPLTATQEYVDAITDDFINYLGIKPTQITVASDDMQKFYRMAGELINGGNAYVCFCSRDELQAARRKGQACPCRLTNPDRNMQEWHSMLNGQYEGGKCVLRLKGILDSPNHVMRDPVIFRIITAEHFRQKDNYRVWPMYDFENPIEDHLCGVTHILRSNEFGTMRIQLQNYIKKLLNLRQQEIVQYGRFSVTGATTKGREIRELIKEKKIIGWDDPRLVTLKALKRRGIQRETFYELALDVGLSGSTTNFDWQTIASINRKILDPKSKRYFFVEEPKKISIEGAGRQKVQLKLHPEHPEFGMRTFDTRQDFYITKKDYSDLKEGMFVRLMDCLNFRKSKSKLIFESQRYEEFKEKGDKIIHWLPAQELPNVEVLMPDGSRVTGLAEPLVGKLKVDDIIQFERFGFCRLDEKKKDKLVFWYTHK